MRCHETGQAEEACDDVVAGDDVTACEPGCTGSTAAGADVFTRTDTGYGHLNIPIMASAKCRMRRQL